MKRLFNHRNLLLTAGSLCIFLVSCEDIITPTLQSAAPMLVVDAWITSQPETQVIVLTQSQPYFDNTPPPAFSGAVVTVSDDHGNTYSFTEDDKSPGKYLWKPAPGKILGQVGYKFKLAILVNGESFEATSYMGRVPAIDSITFDKDKRVTSNEEIVRGEFWAIDPVGVGDTYWIRTYKNGIRLNKPSELTVAYDASFSAGGETDGVTFITPVRRSINSRDTDASGKLLSSIANGDSIQVQIHSITIAAFNYLRQVKVQTDRPGGFQELFSKPLSNVSTNINNVNPSGRKALGFFNVASVSAFGKRYKP